MAALTDEFPERMQELAAQLKAAVAVMEESKSTDTARWEAAKAEQVRIATELTELKKKEEDREREAATAKATADVRDLLSTVRSPSKAALIGFGRSQDGGSLPGEFIKALAFAKSSDHEEQAAGKALLRERGWSYQPSWGNGLGPDGKAATGLSDATGGWLIPNALVDEIIKPAIYKSPWRNLITPVTGVTAAAVDVPVRYAAPAAALVIAWGSAKTNVDLVYSGYSATMYTLAKIHDITNGFLRHSAGAAERDVLGELANAFALGEAYYIVNGSGTSEPYGLYTALLTIAGYITATDFSGNATVAGSILKGIATAAGALAARHVQPTAAVLDAASYWSMLSAGTDTAGFFFTGRAVSMEGVNAGTLVTPFGIPVYPDTTITTGKCIVGDFKALKVYYGEGYRVDSSDVAYTRWDYNVTGFRGEMEMGLDARSAVYAGHFHLLSDVG